MAVLLETEEIVNERWQSSSISRQQSSIRKVGSVAAQSVQRAHIISCGRVLELHFVFHHWQIPKPGFLSIFTARLYSQCLASNPWQTVNSPVARFDRCGTST